MFINDVSKKEEIRNIAIKDLRNFGIKYRPKKQKQHVQEIKKSKKVFKTPLYLLPMQTVTLNSGQQLIVPKLVHELCSFILTKVETEGLFRKGGSKSRQNEIKLTLDAGCYLNDEHHEIDVASVLKTFLRELPEPLLPFSYHELFLRCMLLEKNKLEAVFLACLLLPTEHLNTLAYFMQFLHQVAEFSELNKMDAYNLAVVIGPTILPVEEKIASNTQQRLIKTCELFKLMVENASDIGVLPEHIIERLPSSSSSLSINEEDANKKKKKRRSGSLTRMLNGLKKIVGSKTGEDTTPQPKTVTPDLLLTPCITRSSKKRKVEANGFSLKKKRELIHNLPQGLALNTPFTPKRTPVAVHPNPKKSPPLPEVKVEKKHQWCLRNKNKNTKSEDAVANTKSKQLERRWSTINNSTASKKNKKRNSYAGSLQTKKRNDHNEENKSNEADYVRISKSEYEEIKNRVSEIERCISIELECVKAQVTTDGNKNTTETDTVKHVQTAYEQTLVQAEPLSPTTDHLARRFSRELKIRRSAEQKVFRSPSARKIGTIRRRSRELERHSVRLSRNQSWHVGNSVKTNLKRGRPNTVFTGLSQPGTSKECDNLTVSSPNISANYYGARNVSEETTSSEQTATSTNSWTSAENFFCTKSSDLNNLDNCRASLIRLRNQNAGMVLAKAKLFNELSVDSDSSQTSKSQEVDISIPRAKLNNKIGSTRSTENRNSYRVKILRNEDKRLPKKSLSPRKKCSSRTPNLTQRQRLQKIAKKHVETAKNEKENQMPAENSANNINIEKNEISPLKDCNRIDITDIKMKTLSPHNITPNVKKNVSVKSPKSLLYQQPLRVEIKQIPLRVLSNSNNL